MSPPNWVVLVPCGVLGLGLAARALGRCLVRAHSYCLYCGAARAWPRRVRDPGGVCGPCATQEAAARRMQLQHVYQDALQRSWAAGERDAAVWHRVEQALFWGGLVARFAPERGAEEAIASAMLLGAALARRRQQLAQVQGEPR